MDVLQPVIRPYPWGSRTGIAELQGRPVPSAGPEAELWMGAHPSAPSLTSRGRLDKVIAAAPERELGRACAERYHGRLPFLLKVLSADKALSIQVHPSAAQAIEGFGTERDLAHDDPHRNYVDDWPKPELLCALTPFEVLAGLRPAAEARQFAAALGVPQLAAGTDTAESLRTILEWPEDGRPELIAKVTAGYARLAGLEPGRGGPFRDTSRALLKVAADHPGDAGIVAAMLLNHAVLQPGEAVFMPAGGLHAYLRGTGIELLANSDNVVRAGLTGKHIDVQELLHLLDPSVGVPVITPKQQGSGIAEFGTPAPEFRLYQAELTQQQIPLPGTARPRIVLCVEGTLTMNGTKLARGESCFISAQDNEIAAHGPARAFIAAPGAC